MRWFFRSSLLLLLVAGAACSDTVDPASVEQGSDLGRADTAPDAGDSDAEDMPGGEDADVAGDAADGATDDVGEPDTGEPRVWPPAPTIDGEMGEWTQADLIATDPAGDAGASFDVTRVYARSRGTVLYVRFDIGNELNLQSGEDAEGGLRLELRLPGGRGLTVDFRGRTIYRDGNPSRWISWSRLNFVAAPTHAATDFELRVDLAPVSVEPGETVSLAFAGSDRTDPVDVVLGAPSDPVPPLRSAQRGEGATLRIANLNTRESGLEDGTRAPLIGRLLGAVDADIYCFQEEQTIQESALAFALQQITGKSDWNVYKVRGAIIATRGSMRFVESLSQRYAAARVQLPGAPEVLVVSLHGSCCGHNGSREDGWRIEEAQAVVQTIEDNSDVPAIVIGDWNLVGSRRPLDTIEAAGLDRWQLENLRPGEFWTWYRPESRFTPGQLDILVNSPGLARVHGYILSTHTMTGDAAAALGLMPNDSDGSDHQVLVADFR